MMSQRDKFSTQGQCSNFDKSVELRFNNVDYMVHAFVRGDSLCVEAEEKFTGKRWFSQFPARAIEEMTHKTGNYKKFSVFVKMLHQALDGQSTAVVDLLTYADLEELKARRMGTDVARQPSNPNTKKRNKRYLILTCVADVDRIHYPLTLKFEDESDVECLRRSVARLREENERLHLNTRGSEKEQSNPKFDLVCRENKKLRSLLRHSDVLHSYNIPTPSPKKNVKSGKQPADMTDEESENSRLDNENVIQDSGVAQFSDELRKFEIELASITKKLQEEQRMNKCLLVEKRRLKKDFSTKLDKLESSEEQLHMRCKELQAQVDDLLAQNLTRRRRPRDRSSWNSRQSSRQSPARLRERRYPSVERTRSPYTPKVARRPVSRERDRPWRRRSTGGTVRPSAPPSTRSASTSSLRRERTTNVGFGAGTQRRARSQGRSPKKAPFDPTAYVRNRERRLSERASARRCTFGTPHRRKESADRRRSRSSSIGRRSVCSNRSTSSINSRASARSVRSTRSTGSVRSTSGRSVASSSGGSGRPASRNLGRWRQRRRPVDVDESDTNRSRRSEQSDKWSDRDSSKSEEELRWSRKRGGSAKRSDASASPLRSSWKRRPVRIPLSRKSDRERTEIGELAGKSVEETPKSDKEGEVSLSVNLETSHDIQDIDSRIKSLQEFLQKAKNIHSDNHKS
eukprot:422365_1